MSVLKLTAFSRPPPVIAKGGRLKLAINGVTTCELEDRDPRRLVHGWLGLQVRVGPPMRVQFKDIYLRGP